MKFRHKTRFKILTLLSHKPATLMISIYCSIKLTEVMKRHISSHVGLRILLGS